MTMTPQRMNACVFCKHGKRKCSRTRPSCSNCIRLKRACVYTEDTIQTSFTEGSWTALDELKQPTLPLANSSSGLDLSSNDAIQQSTMKIVMQVFRSLDNIVAISNEFFIGSHQRLPTISKLRFQQNLQSLATTPRADFAALCLSILLMQQKPQGKATNLQSSLYFKVKDLIALLETTADVSLDLVHCRVLVTFCEMGHGLHRAAYLSIAACARLARVLGLHRKRWRNPEVDSNKLTLEEEKRTWWSIVLMDRFINLVNRDALFVTEDPARTDPLPMEDLLWSESSNRADLEDLVITAPFLDIPFNVTVGQLARECQISHLAGRVVRHVFDPSPDLNFNAEEAVQLERTLKAYLPLLSNEELKIGKYCGAYGMCNSSLFVLYEYMLNWNEENTTDRHRILRAIEETALGALNFAEAAYGDAEGNYPSEIFSPYLPYSLCQAAVVHHQLWTQTGNPIYKHRRDKLKDIIRNFTARWMVAWQYLETIDSLDESSPSIGFPGQGLFINNEAQRLWSQ